MKKIFSSFLFSIAVLISSAQNTSVFWGDDMKVKGSTTTMEALFADKTGVYVLDGKRPGIFSITNKPKMDFSLRKFDNNYEQIYEKNYKSDLRDKYFNRFLKFRDRIYIFANAVDGRQNKVMTFVAEIDKSSGDLKTDWKVIASVSKIEKKDIYDYQITTNSDSSLMVLMTDISAKTRSVLKVSLINEFLEEVSTTEINLEYPENSFFADEVMVTADKKIFVIGDVFEEVVVKKNKTRMMFKKIAIEKYDVAANKIFDLPTTEAGKTFVSAKIVSTKKDEIVVCAFYSNDPKTKEVNGIVINRVNAQTGVVLMRTEKVLDNSLVGSFTEDDDDEDKKDKKKASKKDDEDEEGLSSKYIFRKAFTGEDNSVLLVTEKFYMDYYTRMTTTGTGNLARTSYQDYTRFHTGDIMTLKIDKEGSIKFIHVIPKKQMEVMPGTYFSGSIINTSILETPGIPYFSSFNCIPYKNKLIFILNDNERNTSVTHTGEKVKPISVFTNSSCYSLVLDLETGKATRKVLFSNAGEPIAMIRQGVIYGNNFFITAMKGNLLGKSNMKLGRVTVK